MTGLTDSSKGFGNSPEDHGVHDSGPGSLGPAAGRVSLGKRLRAGSVPRLGINPNWCGYTEEERRQIAGAGKVFYPGPVFEQIIRASGSEVFPCNYYYFMGNKIAQTELFQLLEIPHPRTLIYYGRKRLRKIVEDFAFPFIAKTPIHSSQGLGVFLINNENDLAGYLEKHNPAYIQDFLPLNRDLRVVLIGGRVVHAYWRIHCPDDFRNNVSRGGRVSFEDIPQSALDFAGSVALRCRFDEVGLDICEHQDSYLVLEANMAYGLKGFRQKGMDIRKIIGELADEGVI